MTPSGYATGDYWSAPRNSLMFVHQDLILFDIGFQVELFDFDYYLLIADKRFID